MATFIQLNYVKNGSYWPRTINMDTVRKIGKCEYPTEHNNTILIFDDEDKVYINESIEEIQQLIKAEHQRLNGIQPKNGLIRRFLSLFYLCPR